MTRAAPNTDCILKCGNTTFHNYRYLDGKNTLIKALTYKCMSGYVPNPYYAHPGYCPH